VGCGGSKDAYLFPLKGQVEGVLDASATLLCLKGLKSSLIWTLPFFSGEDPKKAFG